MNQTLRALRPHITRPREFIFGSVVDRTELQKPAEHSGGGEAEEERTNIKREYGEDIRTSP